LTRGEVDGGEGHLALSGQIIVLPLLVKRGGVGRLVVRD